MNAPTLLARVENASLKVEVKLIWLTFPLRLRTQGGSLSRATRGITISLEHSSRLKTHIGPLGMLSQRYRRIVRLLMAVANSTSLHFLSSSSTASMCNSSSSFCSAQAQCIQKLVLCTLSSVHKQLKGQIWQSSK